MSSDLSRTLTEAGEGLLGVELSPVASERIPNLILEPGGLTAAILAAVDEEAECPS